MIQKTSVWRGKRFRSVNVPQFPKTSDLKSFSKTQLICSWIQIKVSMMYQGLIYVQFRCETICNGMLAKELEVGKIWIYIELLKPSVHL